MFRKKKKQPKEPNMLDDVTKFTEHLQRDRNYVAAFLMTLELNKLEAKHQKRDEPMIFRKQVDEYGIITWFEMNPIYKGYVPQPKTEFTNEEAATIGELFDKDRIEQLAVMLNIGQIEHVVLSSASREQLENPPPIWKTFDAYGFPQAYALNFPIEIQQ